ncbi:serine/threonine protein kinase [Rubrivirga sp.]|uniref:serine/threonine protein kinase n=1 Tax=Rubrivirga sp. TaxID=1885344 RepID=UPI003C77A4C7
MPRPGRSTDAEAFFARLMDGPLRRSDDLDTEYPARVGHWTLEDEIGRGGGSCVYSASRVTPSGTLQAALKLARRLSPHTLALFDAEAHVLRHLSAPTVAALYDAGQHHDGRPYLALEVVDGECVTDHAKPLRARGRLEVAASMCESVGVLHDAGFVHADLKPAHLIVRGTGDVTVLDLGLAHGHDLEVGNEAQAITPEFAAPEQVLSETVSAQTDVYALGLIAYEVLTERAQDVPWVLGGVEDVLDMPATPSGIAPDSVWASVDWGVVTALRAAVHPSPEQRFATAGAFARSLRAALDATADA